MKWNQKITAFVCAAFLSSSAWALGPQETLSGVIDTVLQNLKVLKDRKELNLKTVDSLVSEKMLPVISTQQVAMRVLGRQSWEQATPAQKTQFIQCFTKVIIATYAAALTSYDNDVVTFLPGTAMNGDLATLRSVINRPTGQKLSMNYLMVNENGQWRVADFSVEGIALDSSYHSQFASILSSGGIPALLARVCAQ